MTKPLPEQIAKAFAAAIISHATPAQFAEIKRRNATPEYAASCATQDFFDANIFMNDAFRAATGRDVDVASDDDAALWNQAWDLAKARWLSDARPN